MANRSGIASDRESGLFKIGKHRMRNRIVYTGVNNFLVSSARWMTYWIQCGVEGLKN